MAVCFCVSTSSERESLFLHILTGIGVVSVQILAILIGVWWCLIISVCLPLMIWSIFHGCIVFGDVPGSSAHFLIRFSLLSLKNCLHILGNSPLSDVSFANIFSQSVIGLLSLLIFEIFKHFFKNKIMVRASQQKYPEYKDLCA